MICPNCATENEAGRKFCLSCGSRLAIVCPGCGSPNNPLARFCGECGAAMATVTGPHAAVEGAAPAPGATMIAGSLAAGGAGRAAPLAERRLVTVLFVDLVGFTSLAEGRDAEVVRDLLGRYFEVARSVVEHHGGTVEKFIGDAVMAVWGAPTAHEDDAERAVRAALEIVDAVRALGPGLEARAGVLTGEAAVTLGAPGQGMVAGDLVNTASRLQSVAPPGSVVVGEATERAASRAIAFEPAGEQLLKGRVAPVQAYRALRVVAERGGRGRSDTLEAPFVGRTEEFRLLKELFHTTARERRVRHVSITGIAGIGKSRLAWEFLKYVDGLVEDTYWHEGRSPAYGEGITFWALGEMVRRRAGLAEADDERTTREKIAAALSRFVPDEAERHWIEPRLLTLLGLEVSVSGGREELFAAWRTFFERVAARGTVVLVFEDLQWADSGLLDFIDHVLEWSRAVPIYIVTLARPELLDRRPDWGAGRRNFTSIHLEPLSEAAMHQLLGGLVPGLPERAVAAMVARSEGVPLYAIETVRMLVSDGTLVAEGGSYRPTRDVSELAVPETLQALIAARLDALDPRERSLLQDASVLGQTFSVAGLAAVSDAAPEAAEANLRSLVRREFLQFVVDPRSPERGQYTFLQALIRDVAYGRLARKERRDRHLAAARYFEMLEDEEIAGVLASHYLAAYRASAEGPEADAAAAQARVALKSAADRASALGSPDQAMTYLERALSTATEPDDQADLLWRAGVAGSDAGHHEAAERFLRRAVEVNRDRGARLGAGRRVAPGAGARGARAGGHRVRGPGRGPCRGGAAGAPLPDVLPNAAVRAGVAVCRAGALRGGAARPQRRPSRHAGHEGDCLAPARSLHRGHGAPRGRSQGSRRPWADRHVPAGAEQPTRSAWRDRRPGGLRAGEQGVRAGPQAGTSRDDGLPARECRPSRHASGRVGMGRLTASGRGGGDHGGRGPPSHPRLDGGLRRASGPGYRC